MTEVTWGEGGGSSGLDYPVSCGGGESRETNASRLMGNCSSFKLPELEV
jgi:hypothetical protein